MKILLVAYSALIVWSHFDVGMVTADRFTVVANDVHRDGGRDAGIFEQACRGVAE